jgi:hypothetical protein
VIERVNFILKCQSELVEDTLQLRFDKLSVTKRFDKLRMIKRFDELSVTKICDLKFEIWNL